MAKATKLPLDSSVGGNRVFHSGNHGEYGDPHPQYTLKISEKRYRGYSVTGPNYVLIGVVKIAANDDSKRLTLRLTRRDNSLTAGAYAVIDAAIQCKGTLSSSNMVYSLRLTDSHKFSQDNFVGLYYVDSDGAYTLEVYLVRYDYIYLSRLTSDCVISITKLYDGWNMHHQDDVHDIGALLEYTSADYTTYATGKTQLVCLGGTKIVGQVIVYYNGSSWILQTPDGEPTLFTASIFGTPAFSSNILSFSLTGQRCIINEPHTKLLSVTPYYNSAGATPRIPILYWLSPTNKRLRFCDMASGAFLTSADAQMAVLMTFEYYE